VVAPATEAIAAVVAPPARLGLPRRVLRRARSDLRRLLAR
jgi:hypothetical protein